MTFTKYLDYFYAGIYVNILNFQKVSAVFDKLIKNDKFDEKTWKLNTRFHISCYHSISKY